jgi:gliding motility-associated-like protein
MRKILLFAAVLWSLGLSAQQGFVRNDGQWEDPSKFVYRFGANAIFLTGDSIVFSILNPQDQHNHSAPEKHHYSDTLHYANFSLKFAGANPLNWKGGEAFDHKNHFYLGHRTRWRTDVPSFHGIIAQDVYPGIDLKLYSASGGMKYDWIVHPGADPSVIVQEYGGIDGLEVLPKKVKIRTAIGTLEEEMPYAYQGREQVRARYQRGKDEVRINLGAYDQSQTLTIDPIYIFSTYSGSQADNFGYTATFDDNGNAFGGGIVFGTGYPVSLGAVDTAFSGGAYDIGISKFSSDGTQLLWSSYLGGSGVDQPHSLECDENGNLYIFGVTGSNDFGVTSSAFDTSFGGGTSTIVDFVSFSNGTDAFISKINSAGDSLIASTYLGGSSNDGINESLGFNYGDGFRGEIEVQRSGGQVFVVSSCSGSDYPVSSGGRAHIGSQDGVISILNRSLDSLLFSSYIGSKGDDAIYSISLAEKEGNSTGSSRLFFAGSTYTDSSFVFLGTDSIQINVIGDQSGLLMAAYFDGITINMLAADATYDTGYDQHYFVEANNMSDTTSVVTVMGQNKGGIVASDSTIWGQSGSTQYFREYKYNQYTLGFDEIKTSVWGSGQSSFIDISPTALMIDFCGNLYFSGWGGSPNYEGSTDDLWTSPNAPQDTTDGRDFYFIVLNKGWKSAEIATFWGGSGREHVDGGTSRFDSKGRIFQAVCAGCGGNSDYPTFPQNVYSSTNNSFNCNLAITVIDLDVQFAKNKFQIPLEVCYPDTLNIVENSENVDLWDVYWGDGTTLDSTDDIAQHFYSSPGVYNITFIGFDTICNSTDTTNLQITVNPPYDSVWIDYSYDYCDPSRQVVATARLVSDSSIVTDYELEWDFAGVNFSSAQVQFNMPVPGANPVSLNVLDTNCNITQLFEDTLVFRIPPFMQINTALEECETRETVDFNAILNATYQGFEWLVDGQVAGNSNPLQISQSGIYDISIVGYDSICGTSDTLTESFDVYFAGEAFTVPNFVTPNNDGINDAFLVNTSENWDDFHLIVHNRWGVKVFETTVISFEWGADYDEKILAPGVYFYQLKATNRCGDITEDGVLHIIY